MKRILWILLVVSVGCKSSRQSPPQHEFKTELSYEPTPTPSMKGLKVSVSISEKW